MWGVGWMVLRAKREHYSVIDLRAQEKKSPLAWF